MLILDAEILHNRKAWHICDVDHWRDRCCQAGRSLWLSPPDWPELNNTLANRHSAPRSDPWFPGEQRSFSGSHRHCYAVVSQSAGNAHREQEH
jgi:hypothetical protein